MDLENVDVAEGNNNNDPVHPVDADAEIDANDYGAIPASVSMYQKAKYILGKLDQIIQECDKAIKIVDPERVEEGQQLLYRQKKVLLNLQLKRNGLEEQLQIRHTGTACGSNISGKLLSAGDHLEDCDRELVAAKIKKIDEDISTVKEYIKKTEYFLNSRRSKLEEFQFKKEEVEYDRSVLRHSVKEFYEKRDGL